MSGRGLVMLGVFALLPSAALGQRPAEVMGRVRDVGGSVIEAASVELLEAGLRTTSDAAGQYRFRSVSPGRYTLLVTRVGFERRSEAVEVERGRTHVVDLVMALQPVTLDDLAVTVSARVDEGVRVGRADIERSGARSAADVLRAFPGVVVRSTSTGGPATVSVRGSAPDAVLVLVDGVVLNDPLTGEADLSTVSADAVQSLELLPGARSARYGPRAEAGVILIETRMESAVREISGSAGSLGARSAGAAWGHAWPIEWNAGAEWRALDGAFDFDLPPEVGGGSGRRDNADARTVSAWAGVLERVAAGNLRLRGSGEWVRRGLPGRSYAPSAGARQTVDRMQGSASWERSGERGSARLSLASSGHEIRFRDGTPPFGLPYDDTARVSSVDVRAEAERRAGGAGVAFGVGLEARRQSVRASALAEGTPTRRNELGAFGHASYTLRLGAHGVLLSGELRADRDPADDWTVSRSLTLASSTLLGLDAHVAVRSSYSPPTLADQYFRAEVGVEPNPDLTAERIPLEVEAGVAREIGAGPVRASLGVTAYRGDVRGMIVWVPDYRFVWSPRNVDVKRVGLESRALLSTVDDRVQVRLLHSYTGIVYDRPPPDDDVQVIYRPRHTASAELGWESGAWLLDVGARFTGVRYPVPAPVNALPSFWTTTASLSRSWLVRGWTLTPAVRADRLFGERESLIFGFPEPGRTLRVDIALRP